MHNVFPYKWSHPDPVLPDGDAAPDRSGPHSGAVKVAACPVPNLPTGIVSVLRLILYVLSYKA